jgi:exo-1,4-beta-D-glucosaminidase
VTAQGVVQALALPRFTSITPVFFVRCELFDAGGVRLVDNVYWQSVTPDIVGPLANDSAFNATEEQWADFTPLRSMAKVALDIKGTVRKSGAGREAVISLHNPSSHPAFFVRAEITSGKDGNEILPVTYDNNYVTVFPGETVLLRGKFDSSELAGNPLWLRAEGVNAPKDLIPMP